MTSAFPIASDCSERIFGMQPEQVGTFNRQDTHSKNEYRIFLTACQCFTLISATAYYNFCNFIRDPIFESLTL
jgi:hypothetical protein